MVELHIPLKSGVKVMFLSDCNVMPYTYPSTNLYLLMHCWVHITLGRNLVFSQCCQKSPLPCSQLGPAPTSVSAPEKTFEAEGNDGMYPPEQRLREYYSERKSRQIRTNSGALSRTNFHS